MKKLLIISVVVLSLPVLLIGGLLALMIWSERIDKEYDSYAETAPDRAYGKWMPQVLPESSREIRMTYYIDALSVWVSFEFLAEDLNMLEQKCEELSRVDIARANWPVRDRGWRPVRGPGWWPDELSEAYWKHPEPESRFQVFLCADKAPTLFAATNEGEWRKGYLWSSGFDLMQ